MIRSAALSYETIRCLPAGTAHGWSSAPHGAPPAAPRLLRTTRHGPWPARFPAGPQRSKSFPRSPGADKMTVPTQVDDPDRPLRRSGRVSSLRMSRPERCQSGRLGRSRKRVSQKSAFSEKREKTLENKAFLHFLALYRNVPKCPEMCPSGSTYYRSKLLLPGFIGRLALEMRSRRCGRRGRSVSGPPRRSKSGRGARFRS